MVALGKVMAAANPPKFLSTLNVQPLKGPWYRLTHKLVYRSHYTENPIVVPAGFVTDFTSTRLPILYWFAGEVADKSGTVHDWLYRERGHLYDRKTCDLIYHEAMGVEGYGMVKRNAFYYGLRIFGGSAYHQHTELDPR